MMNVMKVINQIKAAERVAIMSHIYPDGDAVGSSLALALALEKLGKKVDVYLQDGVPVVYSFLTGANKILREWNGNEYDMAIAVDSGDMERLGTCDKIFNSAAIKINIDHHITNTNFGEYNHIEAYASAAGEIIYRIIKMASIDLDKEIAECLYVAIATDTGGFRFSNTTSICMQVAAELINYEIDVSDISRKVFDVTSLTKTKLIGIAIESLELLADGKIAVMQIDNHQMVKLGANFEEFDGIISIARNITGVEAAAFFLEKKSNEIKVNLRSNAYVDVSEVAKKYSGGGHKRAAGCTITAISLEEAKNKIVDELCKFI